MQMKDRKTYSLKNFRGLDKENKLSKVAPYRASDGQNFIIDSETLKTRPAFKHYKEPSIILDSNDYIIDWYEYNDISIYITKNHIYINDGELVLDETTVDNNFIHNVFNTFDFSGLTPLFQEEKNCLFVFCLNSIFVFSALTNVDKTVKKYVLYDLKNKPDNIFTESDEFYKPYDELPTPYEPTLFIGDNRYEDVNLLSNVSKYSLFANVDSKQDGGKVLYTLPTHYDKSKHGNFEHEITFFKNKLKDLEILPVYLGVLNENINSSTEYGTVINELNPTEIQDVFTPLNEMEYFGTSASITKKISGIIGLDKNTFFNFKIKNSNQKVFDFLISYIRTNVLNENTVYVFKLPIEYVAVYRDETTNYIVERNVKKEYINVYVNLRKTEVSQFVPQIQGVFESEIMYEEKLTTKYPELPYQPELFDKVLNIGENQTTLPTENTFRNDVDNILFTKQNEYNNGEMIIVIGKYKEERTSGSLSNAILDEVTDWKKSTVQTTFPAYPSFDSTGIPTSDIIELDIYTMYEQPNIDLNNKNLQKYIFTNVLNKIETFSKNIGRGFAKLKIQNTSSGLKQSLVIGFQYDKGKSEKYYAKKSFALVCKIIKQTTPVFDGVSEFTFNEDNNMFELKVKDYFFDYNNEPSIDIKVKFEFNPDYEMISKSKFGINFGSENRLFLAGNEKYPNIDRYNVSNDLLGNNQKNQSYELSYFPSKNYRVIGGNGKINGYVVATDTTLYVTKEEYSNDEKLFIRERILDEKGIVGYKEFKTSINQTPLNHKCLVRFYNDILMLTKDGLHAIEISSNVLTNERLIKLRSGFINKDLVSTIKDISKEKIFMIEDNNYLYIFIDKDIYVADSRYIDNNKNSEVQNLSYEIVKWNTLLAYKTGHFKNKELILLDDNGTNFYIMKYNENTDEKLTKYNSAIKLYDISSVNHVCKNAFQLTKELEYILDNPKNFTFSFETGYKVFAKTGDYEIVDNKINILDYFMFTNIQDGDVLYFKDSNNIFYPFTVKIIDYKINLTENTLGDKTTIFYKIDTKPLYISLIFDYDLSSNNNYSKVFRLSTHKNEEVKIIEKQSTETDLEYLSRLDKEFVKHQDYLFLTENMLDCVIKENKPIEMLWISNLTDFGNNLMEKTMFKVNLYATKQAQENTLLFGYKTMRGHKTLSDTRNIAFTKPFDMDNINFNSFAITTFNEFGVSLPLKENNFLYIQFMVKGYGNIELNAIEIIYKLNRYLKTIG